MVRCIPIILCLCALGARAGEVSDAQRLGQEFPPGSITTKEIAERALSGSEEVHRRLQLDFEGQRQHCANVFLVNHCLDSARQVQRNGEREVRRITLEAHDLQRQLDARAHAESRAADLRRQAEEDLQRPERERQAMLAAQAREQNAAARAQDALHDQETAAKAQAQSQQRQHDQAADVAHKEALRPQQEAEASRAFKEKQEQAAAYAQTRAQDREANAKRRAERQAAREEAAKSDKPAPAPGPP